ncbi:MAG: preprotein translocase subunit SecA [Candidatus Harrisonbacteria bacterium]|nr:preprotein translocase subunit SecA [Candidatus Harrisonbacteria bacterium]
MRLLNFLFNPTKKLEKQVGEINALELEISKLTDVQIREEGNKLRNSAQGGSDLDGLLPRAFALVREAAKRTLGQRHFDVQLIGGMVLHEGKIAEMSTGEGKTLASTAPVYLNALEGKGVHVVTVNEYLAKRDAVWMGQIYNFLGLSVACLVHEGAFIYDPAYIAQDAEKLVDKERDTTGSFLVQQEYLRPISRRDAYFADITYGTNHEFGFDYLRDNLAYSKEQQVQYRGNNYAIVDEIDSILIDEARTPLIISAPDTESSELYKTFSRLAASLQKDEDYIVDEKYRSVDITEAGIDRVEKALRIDNIYAPENLRLTHYLEESLKSHALFKRDKDYVVKDNEIIIVDQNTGRLMLGRRYSGGLHQAIEAKEGVRVQQESRTYAQITIQNYFRLYKKLAGMTGTAQTSAEEFDKVYGLPAVTIPTNKPVQRKNLPDVIYKTADAKFQAVAKEVKEKQKQGQPVLIGTISIEKNELLSQYLNREGVRHEVLNAKNNEREGAIIAQAGRAGSVTVATNMAGRGVDIILGGNPPDILESEKVKTLGGLHVIGTERHDARRIDNQLRGRSGRQGDPGSSQFFLSVEDDLMRIFGGDRIKSLMETLDVPEDMPIESGLVSKAVTQAQSRVEGFNFDARKHLLEYDDIFNKQRTAIYEKRQKMLEDGTQPQVLMMLDMLWMNHLENIEALRESVRLRAYGQHDPLVEYRRESRMLYDQLLADFDKWMEENKERIAQAAAEHKHAPKPIQTQEQHSGDLQMNIKPAFVKATAGKVGRNDPCPCGSGKKYKRCHGK